MEDKKKTSKQIEKTLEQNRKDIDIDSKQIKGYGRAMSKIIDPSVSSIDWNNMNVTNANNISTDIFGIRGKDNLTNEQLSELMYAYASKMNDVNQNAVEDFVLSQRHVFKEYEVLVKEMPEIQKAINMMASDVVYPNGQGITGIKIEFKNNKDNLVGETYNDLIQYFRPLSNISLTLSSKRLYSFDIEQEAMKRIKSCMIYGAALIATVPYSDIAADILYDSHKKQLRSLGDLQDNQGTGESYFFYDNFEKDIEDLANKNYEKRMNNYKESVDEILKGESFGFEQLVGESEDISKEYGSHYLDPNFYSRADLDETMMVIQSQLKDIRSDNESFKANPLSRAKDISQLVSYSEDMTNVDIMESNPDVFKALQEIKDRRKNKFNLNKIKGCTSDFLDLKRVIPLFIKNELMGVLVMREESEFANQKLGTTLRMILSPDQISYHNPQGDGNKSYKQKVKEIILKDMGKTLERNISRKMLRNNPTLMEDIEYLLDGLDPEELLNTKIRFIPSQYLTLYKIGDGDMGTSVLEESKPYIHACITLTKNRMLHETLLNKDVWLFKIPHSNDGSAVTRIMEHLTLFRDTMPSLENVVNSSVVNQTLAQRSVILVPQLPNGGGDLFEIQKLDQTEFTEPNDELLAKLRNAATMPFGYPADVLDPSQNADFAKKIAQINLTTLMMVLTYQRLFTIPLSEECTKRLRYLTGNHDLECIISFDPPSELNDQVMEQRLNQTNTISDLYFAYIDNDVSIKDDMKALVKFYANQELMKNVVDLDLLEKAKERAVVEGAPSPVDNS